MSNFMPELHFIKPSEKLKDSWAKMVVDYYYHNTHNIGLLDDKNVEEINAYFDGSFSMEPYKRMFKSLRKENRNRSKDRNAFRNEEEFDSTGIDWTPLALMPMKFNAAISTVHKIPIEITCKANDLLAAEKVEEDIKFLKHKPEMEADLQELADQMGIGKVDLGETKHSDTPYGDSPYGLDLNDPNELDVFKNILYKLGVVSAFETGLTEYWNLKEADEIRGMEIEDQFKYGVSCHQAFDSAITGLPDIDYVYAGNIKTPESRYKDYRDNTHRIHEVQMTPMDLFNRFGKEICSEDALYKILNEDETGYCAKCKKDYKIEKADWGKKKLDVVYFEVKSIDWVGVVKKPNNSKNKKDFYYLTTEEKSEDGIKCTGKIWGQNTYCFWWLKNTEHYFGIDRLGFAHRTKGLESYQNFTTNIYRSQKKSAAELAIGKNKIAQIADIKLQHCIIKSQPPGKTIDLAFIRNAAVSLKNQDGQPLYTIDELVRLIFEENTTIGDSTGVDGTLSNAMKPSDNPGGLNRIEAEGYLSIIRAADYDIERLTGINGQLTGASSNPESLVGMQKLLINQAINSLWYCSRAINVQYRKLFPLWAYVLKKGIESGGKVKEMIEQLIGAKKVTLIDKLKELSLHEIGVSVDITMREEERADFRQNLMELKQKGVINSADVYMINSVQNPREQMALLAVKEIQYMKRLDRERREQMAHQQQMVQQQNEGMMQAKNAEVEGAIKKEYAKGDVTAKMMQLADTLGMNQKERDAAMKRVIQKDRLDAQEKKAFGTIREKSNAKQQEAYGGF